MRSKFLIALLLTVSSSCNYNQPNPKQDEKTATELQGKSLNETPVYDRLKNHFDLYRITPSIIINNTQGNQTDIQLGNYKIKWINNEDETKIKIDNDLFTLKDKETLNVVNGIVRNKKDAVDFANNWDEVRLYKYNEDEYIGIRMPSYPCVGLGCSVHYFLIYDTKTKTKNFFGTFRVDNELELFNFSNDDKIDYVSKTYNADIHNAETIEIVYQLYSIDTDGKFREQKDENGLTYQIKHTTFPTQPAKFEELIENWVVDIK